MRAGRGAAIALVGTAMIGLVVGCSSRDTETPVPVTAQAPFVCAGVPSGGVELITGASDPVVTEEGRWGADDRNFYCTVTVEQSAGRFRGLTVIEERVATSIYGDAERARSELLATSGQRIEADVEGVGVVYGSTEGALTAVWACTDRVLWVEAQGVFDDSRDAQEDLSNLLRSMLPWTCDGQDAPARTAEG